jgi:3',5'-cyclic AMP phosphodiesterase CpdA
MTLRCLVHLSDLHLPADLPAQSERLVATVKSLDPDLIIVTGDITRHGSLRQFKAGLDFMQALPYPAMVLPGNHDVPYLNLLLRLFRPFQRLVSHFPGVYFQNDDGYMVVGLTTAAGFQWRLDWSLGSVSLREVEKSCALMQAEPKDKWRIVASHHPLYPDEQDPYRSQTLRAQMALEKLVQAGGDIFLHGHLHRQRAEAVTVSGRQVLMIGASTALGDRERGQPSGFNALVIEGSTLRLIPYIWQQGDYFPAQERAFQRSGAET